MYLRVFVMFAAVVTTASWTSAQGLPVADDAASVVAGTPIISGAAPAADEQAVLLPSKAITPVVFGTPTPKNPFTSIGHDLKRFFSKDTATVLGILAPAAGVAYTWDKAGIAASQDLSKSFFEAGSVAGSFLVQTGAGVATWAVGRMTGSRKTADVGSDLLRAQFVSQIIVQGVKFTTRRQRPDDSNNGSFPSGHTASAFATATVLDRHFSKKVAIPAYAFASYVALSRMSANKHHVSDVIMGAAVGIAAGRTVTVGMGGAKFSMGVAPTQGGAAVMFTKKP